ncbi:MAG: hypoxanthine phosphoribosyltransferase [Clostridia bacterium]|jgi:hypoxanthine phosphoribosyltransferase|nr:hypoxanthine phosphoribosyltransferase [Clostridia bacterium]MDD4570967.1 hypoxanthine phosphoribosyltransferase [Clostridia bacterium]
MHKDFENILFTEKEVVSRIEEMGQEVSAYYKNKGIEQIAVIGVLKGAFIFMADLVRKISIGVEIDFVQISSYGVGAVTSGKPVFKKDVDIDIEGKHILLVEDIVDTGITLTALKKFFAERKPASITLCTLVDKPSRRKVDLKPEFRGFAVPDKFIVGYGMDYAEKYRDLPYIGILSPNIYTK